MSALTVSPEYRTLLKKVPPKAIRTDRENEAYAAACRKRKKNWRTC
jgi:hypothetical protein